MFRSIILSLSLFLISSSMLYTTVHSEAAFCGVEEVCDNNNAVSTLPSKPMLNDLISSDSVTVMASSPQVSLYNLWSYLLYRWSIVLYFVPLIVIVLCKCKVINCDVQLIYGSMPDDSV